MSHFKFYSALVLYVAHLGAQHLDGQKLIHLCRQLDKRLFKRICPNI